MPDDTPAPSPSAARVRVEGAIGAIDPETWDRLANPDPARFDPFISHAFLQALETSGSVGPGTGWQPLHLVLEDEAGAIAGVAPGYLKSHSQGEFVFDHAWANAFADAGGRYYPKYQLCVPFTPVPGRRLLVAPGAAAEANAQALAAAAIEVAARNGLSSVHMTFVPEALVPTLAPLGFLNRTGHQYHWHNAGYATFDDFLAALASRKRKAVRKERAEAVSSGLNIVHVTGAAITETHWDQMFAFYMDTGNRKWGRPYLTRAFFSALGRTMADRCLLVFAQREGVSVAGALNLIGGDCLYGRYWGATEHHPSLHFELCYYQAIDYAIAHKLARVEAGAQGDHKLTRGYLPVATHSLHWLAHPGLKRAIAHFLARERAAVSDEIAGLAELGPYRHEV